MTESAGKTRIRVLFFSQRFPVPMDTGGKIRTGKLLEQLKSVFDVTLVSNMESPKDDPHLEEIKNLCAEFCPVPWKEARKYSIRFYLKLFLAMFSRYPFTVINDYSREMEVTLAKLIRSKRFDLFICDFLQPSLNVLGITGIPKLLFEHNIESIIPQRHFETSRNPLGKVFWWLQWRRMERYEKETCRNFAVTVTVSEPDKKWLERFGVRNVFAIPTGVDTDYFSPREDNVIPNSIVFTGSMDWLPNEDGILFFVREILGRVKREIPDVRFTVVGRNPSRYLVNELKAHPEVTVTGWVTDVRSYLSSHMLYVIPLRIGGGTRIKAYEAMAMGKAMVSTSVGVEGLPVRDGEHLAIADDPVRFASEVVRLLRDNEAKRRLEENAKLFVQTNFSWGAAAASFANICRQVVQPKVGEQCLI